MKGCFILPCSIADDTACVTFLHPFRIQKNGQHITFLKCELPPNVVTVKVKNVKLIISFIYKIYILMLIALFLFLVLRSEELKFRAMFLE